MALKNMLTREIKYTRKTEKSAFRDIFVARFIPILQYIYIYTVEQAKFASAIISRIRELVSLSRSYCTQSIGCLVTLSTTGGDGVSVSEFHP